uniref:Ribosomal protein S2 n=1 Tax=Stylonychia lemnae TaxID=5949 RepID=A0A3Q8BMS1_STYLE|nr:ribosomal protein S2 [Stylonychia lemnae]
MFNTWMIKSNNNDIIIPFFFNFVFLTSLINRNTNFFLLKKIFAFLNINTNRKIRQIANASVISKFAQNLRKLDSMSFITTPETLHSEMKNKDLDYENSSFKLVAAQDNILFFRFINFFFSLNFSYYSHVFKNSKFSRFFFYYNKGGRLKIINSRKLINRWLNSIDLLYNLNYFYLKPLVMSIPFFRKECLSFNWYFSKWEFSFWKLAFPFFVRRTNAYHRKVGYFYALLKEDVSAFFIVTDCIYHFKNLYYLRKNHFFTIGFVNLAGNPWVVNYPVINMIESLTNQAFFFKILSYTTKLASYHRFLFFKKLWTIRFF